MIYTRSELAGRECVRLGRSVVIETHLSVEQPEFQHVSALAASSLLLRVVTISPILKAAYVDAGIPEKKIVVEPDAVDLCEPRQGAGRTELRSLLGLPRDAFIATYCGHMYAHRGVEDILDAAARLPNVEFVLVGGWDEDVERVRKTARSLRNVSVRGFVPHPQVFEYLQASNVLLMPYPETCETAQWMSPLKLFEYMAAERPIVATDLPALRSHLTDRRTALLVPSSSGAALAGAISELQRDSFLARATAKAAAEEVKTFTWDRRAKRVLHGISP